MRDAAPVSPPRNAGPAPPPPHELLPAGHRSGEGSDSTLEYLEADALRRPGEDAPTQREERI